MNEWIREKQQQTEIVDTKWETVVQWGMTRQDDTSHVLGIAADWTTILFFTQPACIITFWNVDFWSEWKII